MKPTKLIDPFAELYERRGWHTTASGEAYYSGRTLVYVHRGRSWTLRSGKPEKSYIRYHHRLGGEPAYHDHENNIRTWDIGGMEFFGLGHSDEPITLSRQWIKPSGIQFEPKSLDESDYFKAEALWYEMFGRNWLDSIMKQNWDWHDKWVLKVREARLIYT